MTNNLVLTVLESFSTEVPQGFSTARHMLTNSAGPKLTRVHTASPHCKYSWFHGHNRDTQANSAHKQLWHPAGFTNSHSSPVQPQPLGSGTAGICTKASTTACPAAGYSLCSSGVQAHCCGLDTTGQPLMLISSDFSHKKEKPDWKMSDEGLDVYLLLK